MNMVLTVPQKSKHPNPMPFGATAPDGTSYSVNSRYFLRNNEPWYLIMGEFHYSRYPMDEWEENLQKMKAGGVQIIATYVFWIHHEEEKGVWDFSGQRDLHHFVALCQKVGLLVWLRIGPWAHGEARNGGFPDWLQQDKNICARSDDPAYLALVHTLYQKIMDQVRGFQLLDGGPIIGVQLENEYGHCGGESGGAGLVHMQTLKQMAIAVGFTVPFYSATGWGGGNVVDGEMLPVQGGYVDAPWEQHTNPLPPSGNFLLMPFRNDPLIGSDWGHQGDDFTFNVAENPYLTAELGGGMQVTLHRRPLVSGDDTTALALCKLATGANLLGYYMYHGGTNPKGKLSTLQESTANGSYTDVPVLSYDFQAVVGEYGELHDSYRKLKNLHLMLQEFGNQMAPTVPVFPQHTIVSADNTEDIRFCVRHNFETGGGFLFFNQHQRMVDMKNHGAVQFEVALEDTHITFPPITVDNHCYGVYPYRLPLGDSLLISTNAQLLCDLGEQTVFVCGEEKPVFIFDGAEAPVLVLTPKQAELAWKFDDALYLTEAELLQTQQGIRLITEKQEEMVVIYPEKATQRYHFDASNAMIQAVELDHTDVCVTYELSFDLQQSKDLYDVIMEMTYQADRAELYHGQEMIADWYSIGKPWRVSMGRFDYPEKLTLKLYPRSCDVYYDMPPESGLHLDAIKSICKYTTLI